jgi:hypothetical protein
MGKDPEAEGEHEANRKRRDERRHVQHGGGPKELGPGVTTLTMNGGADNP